MIDLVSIFLVTTDDSHLCNYPTVNLFENQTSQVSCNGVNITKGKISSASYDISSISNVFDCRMRGLDYMTFKWFLKYTDLSSNLRSDFFLNLLQWPLVLRVMLRLK